VPFHYPAEDYEKELMRSHSANRWSASQNVVTTSPNWAILPGRYVHNGPCWPDLVASDMAKTKT
jgi:hypothetical protein